MLTQLRNFNSSPFPRTSSTPLLSAALQAGPRSITMLSRDAGKLGLALSAVLLCSSAQAELSDTVHPFIDLTVLSDSNLLRLPDGQDYNGNRSDTYRVVDGGFIFERPVSRQYFSAQVKLSKVSFDHFSQLDYNGKDVTAGWNWVLGNHLSGHLTGLYSETLAPFNDFHTDERNVRTHTKVNADGAYLFHPRWQARAAFSREKFGYDLASQKYNDRREDTSEVGFDYLAPSGSKIGLQADHIKGTYPDGSVAGVLLHDAYTQDELKANVVWNYSGVSSVQFLGGYARRQHAVYTDRDDRGFNGRVVANWMPLGKVKFSGAAWRSFAALDGSVFSSSLNKGISLDTTYTATAKLSVDLLLHKEKRDYNTAGVFRDVAAVAGTSDDTTGASLALTYMATQGIQLTAAATHDKRDGANLSSGNSFKSNGVSFSARAQF